MHTGRLQALEQRTELLGVRDHVPGVVQCHPTAPEAFNELSPHSVNSTSAPPSRSETTFDHTPRSRLPLVGAFLMPSQIPAKFPCQVPLSSSPVKFPAVTIL